MSQTTPTATGRPARIALALTMLVVVGVVTQAVLAGAFFEGAHASAVDAHEAIGPLLLVPAVLAAVVCMTRLRAVSGGHSAGTVAVGSTVALAVEAGLGFASDQHSGLLVLHIPVALGLIAMLSRQVTALAVIARRDAPGRSDQPGR